MNTNRILLDSRDPFDAGTMGYDRPCDPVNGSGGLIVELYCRPIPSVSIIDENGSVELVGLAELRAVSDSLRRAIGILEGNHSHEART